LGYYTNYTLTQERNPIPAEKLAQEISSHPAFNAVFEADGSSVDAVKWYEHNEDMLTLSAKYPDTVFKLYGVGEEQGDIWAKFYHAGKMKHEIRLKAELPPVDLDAIAPVVERVPEFDQDKAAELAAELFYLLGKAKDFITTTPYYKMGHTGAHHIVTTATKLLADCQS
jgi:hypothetical protein